MQELGPENVKPGLNRLPGETWGALGQRNEGSRQSYLGLKRWGGTKGSLSYRHGSESQQD